MDELLKILTALGGFGGIGTLGGVLYMVFRGGKREREGAADNAVRIVSVSPEQVELVETLLRELRQAPRPDRTQALAQVLNLPHVPPRKQRPGRRGGNGRRRGEVR